MADLQTRAHLLAPPLENAPARWTRIRSQLDLLSLQARELTGKLDARMESLEQQLDRGLEQAMRAALQAAVAG